MCEYSQIIDQIKDMAGLDWGALGDNLTREVLVASLDFSPLIEEKDKIRAEAEACIKAKADWDTI